MKFFILLLNFFISTNLFSAYSDYHKFVDVIFYQEKGDYKKALDLLDEIIKSEKNKNHLEPYLYKYGVELAVKSNSIKYLNDYINELLKIEPDNSDNWILYGNLKNMEGDKKEAEKAFRKAVELNPENVEAYYQLAILVGNKNMKEAEKYFNKIIEIDSNYKSDVYYNMAVLYAMKHNEKEMLEYINKSIKADSYSLKPYYFLAVYWKDKGEVDKVIETYRKMLDIEPSNTEVLLNLADIYLSQKKFDEAEKYYLKVLEYDKENSRALWWLAVLNESKKDFKKAKSYLSKIKGWEDDPGMVLKMSYYYVTEGDFDKALNILEKAQQKWPDDLELIYYLALGYTDKKEDEKAKKYFEIIVSTKPDFYDARFNLAVVCERLNDIECFESNFRYLLNKNPNDANVLNYLGYSLIDRGLKLDEAIEMVEKAVKLEPQNIAYLDSLAWGYYKKGESLEKKGGDFEKYYSMAQTYIQKAYNLMIETNAQEDSLIYEHMADIYYKNKRFLDSYKMYKMAYRVLADKKRENIIIEKTGELVEKISAKDIVGIYLSDLIFSKYQEKGNITVNYSYRKFLKKKKIKYSFPLLSNVSVKDKHILVYILSPMMSPVAEIELNGDEFKFNVELDRMFDADKLKGNVYKISKLLRWFYSGSFVNPEYEEKISDGLCLNYKDVLFNGDKVRLCSENYLTVSDMEYFSDKSEKLYRIKFKDWRLIREKNNEYYMPYEIIIKAGKKTFVNIKVNEVKLNDRD